jgi:RNA polymerase-binding transcription factor DksA
MATTIRWARSARPGRHARFEKLEESLRREHFALCASNQALSSAAPVETSPLKDVIDESCNVAEQTVRFAILEAGWRRIREVETALARLQAGTYGTCADCSGNISAPRLRALPTALMCRACQEHQDASARPTCSAGVDWDGRSRPLLQLSAR